MVYDPPRTRLVRPPEGKRFHVCSVAGCGRPATQLYQNDYGQVSVRRCKQHEMEAKNEPESPVRR